MSDETPILKHQKANKSQCPKFKSLDKIFGSLDIWVLELFGICNLVIGAFKFLGAWGFG
jgi:hypothetical protein